MKDALAGLAALAVAMGIGRFAFTPILPMMQAEGSLDVVHGGWLASANYVGYLVGALSAVSLPLPTGRAIRWSLATVCATTAAMALGDSFIAWSALRFAAGVASAWVLVFASARCLERFQRDAAATPAQRARRAAALYAGVGIGIAIAGTACALLIARGAGAASAWLLLALAGAILSASAWPSFREVPRAAAMVPAARTPWDLQCWTLIACYGAFGFGYIIPATFLSAMARSILPDPALYGWSWPLFGAAAAGSTFLAAALRHRWSERATWIVGHVAMAAGVAVPIVLPGVAGIVLSALLVGGTFMVVTMAGMQEARRIAGDGARPLMAAMTSAFAAGQIAGPLVVSALAARGASYDAALAGSATALLLSALTLIALSRWRRSP